MQHQRTRTNNLLTTTTN